jgi:hypothetical protein
MSALRSMDGLLKLSDVTTVIAYHRLFDFDVLLFRVFLLSLFLKHSRTSSIDRDEMIATDFIWPLANLAISTTECKLGLCCWYFIFRLFCTKLGVVTELLDSQNACVTALRKSIKINPWHGADTHLSRYQLQIQIRSIA